MAYQLYKKIARYGRRGIGPTEISITRTAFGIGSIIGKEFEDAGYVEVYLDRKNNKVGFKPTLNRISGFTLTRKKQGSIPYLVIKSLMGYLPVKGKYEAVKEDDMWVIEVPEILSEDMKDNYY